MTRTIGYVCSTSKGWIGVAASARGIAGTTRPFGNEADAREELAARFNDLPFGEARQDPLVERLQAKLEDYFCGKRVIFDEPVDLGSAPAFRQRALEAARRIPYGEVRSYAWVAREIGNPGAARAVGQAMHYNPAPFIIPCHRVIASDGRLCGFGWGLDFKEWLLKLEGASV